MSWDFSLLSPDPPPRPVSNMCEAPRKNKMNAVFSFPSSGSVLNHEEAGIHSPSCMPEFYLYSKSQWPLDCPTGLGICTPVVWSIFGRMDQAKSCTQALEAGMGLFGWGILRSQVPITWPRMGGKVSKWGITSADSLAQREGAQPGEPERSY